MEAPGKRSQGGMGAQAEIETKEALGGKTWGGEETGAVRRLAL
jgi:hypothetical protein